MGHKYMYAAYDDDELPICIGTLPEVVRACGVKENTILSSIYHTAKRKGISRYVRLGNFDEYEVDE